MAESLGLHYLQQSCVDELTGVIPGSGPEVLYFGKLTEIRKNTYHLNESRERHNFHFGVAHTLDATVLHLFCYP